MSGAFGSVAVVGIIVQYLERTASWRTSTLCLWDRNPNLSTLCQLACWAIINHLASLKFSIIVLACIPFCTLNWVRRLTPMKVVWACQALCTKLVLSFSVLCLLLKYGSFITHTFGRMWVWFTWECLRRTSLDCFHPTCTIILGLEWLTYIIATVTALIFHLCMASQYPRWSFTFIPIRMHFNTEYFTWLWKSGNLKYGFYVKFIMESFHLIQN